MHFKFKITYVYRYLFLAKSFKTLNKLKNIKEQNAIAICSMLKTIQRRQNHNICSGMFHLKQICFIHSCKIYTWVL